MCFQFGKDDNVLKLKKPIEFGAGMVTQDGGEYSHD
jgi:hypothetical protein